MTTTSAPLQIQLRFFLPTSPGEAFRWVSERLLEWFRQIHGVEWDHTRSRAGALTLGACSERVCNFGGKTLVEEITAVEASRSYESRADLARSGMKMPIHDHRGTFELEPGDGGTEITWRQYFRPAWYVPGALLRWQMGSRLMRPGVEVLFSKIGGRWL